MVARDGDEAATWAAGNALSTVVTETMLEALRWSLEGPPIIVIAFATDLLTYVKSHWGSRVESSKASERSFQRCYVFHRQHQRTPKR